MGLCLKRGGLRGRTYATVTEEKGAWVATLWMHNGPWLSRTVRCESEADAVRMVQKWLENLVSGIDAASRSAG